MPNRMWETDRSRVFENTFGRVELFKNDRGLTLNHAFWGNVPCYRIDARGDTEAYFGLTDEKVSAGAMLPNILQIQERGNGTWSAWYVPSDGQFQQHADALIALDEWK